MSLAAITAKLRRSTKNLWRSRFVRSVAVVAGGTAGAQAITMAFAPVITRLYGPEEYGVLGTFMAMLSVAAPVAALAYPIAVVLPRRDEEALGLLSLSAYISIFIAALVAVALWLGGDVVIALLGIETVGNLIYLLPVAMLFAAWLQMAQQWLIRKKEFGVIARSAIAHSGVLNGAKALAGLAHPVAAVLIVVATLGNAVYAGLMIIGIRRRTTIDRSETSEGREPSVTELARRHRDFPLYRAPQNTINAASQGLPVLLLAAFFGPASAGFYALAKSVAALPVFLLGKSVNDVFYPRINEAVRDGEKASALILKATVGLGALGLLPMSVLMVGGGAMFEWVFGEGWAPAGNYAQWLALWLLAALMNKPSVSAIPVFGRQRWFLAYEVVGIIARVAALAAGFLLFESDVMAVALFSLVGVVLNIYLILDTVRFCQSIECKSA